MAISTDDRAAVAGGKPAKTKPFNKEKRYGEPELKQLTEALEQGSLFFAHGKKVHGLEAAFAKVIGTKYAVACSSGTAAIHGAMIAAGISPGDEVITAPITDMGSIVPILWQGAIPVFADLDPRTYNMDPGSVEKCITPATKAILLVHLAGNPCDMNAMKEIAARHNVMLIEDCAQAHGCLYEGKPVGSFGAMGCFSYNEFKHISCGDGGVICTDDEKLYGRLRLSVDKCYNRSPTALDRSPTFLAANYRMTELQGGVAIAQLEKLPSIVERRRKWCGELSQRLEGVAGIDLPVVTHAGTTSWWFYLMRINESVMGAKTDEVAAALKAEGLPVAAHYIGKTIYEYPLMVNHSAFDHGAHPFAKREYKKGLCPNAEAILATCIMLPVNEAHDQQDLDETAHGIQRVARYFQSKRSA
ncbi:MAG TPA: DegT/DnrJ/EryC1/StrS family aminotransferase [Tepidisphaeraceae bacterium]|jgi:dTDP-4-amino-4,6-dideoxygalactose transaminase|nr:DegT/DnrJ/EryC1/StrS family aminotransferase [Tepidisphaeraceae bacterium]